MKISTKVQAPRKDGTSGATGTQVTRRVFIRKTPLLALGAAGAAATVISGCEGSKNKGDAGVDGGRGPRATDTDFGTDMGTDTESVLNCPAKFERQKNEALLRSSATGDYAVLGPDGVIMKADIVTAGSADVKYVQVSFTDLDGNTLDSAGNIVQGLEDKYNAIEELHTASPTITVIFGGETQTITLCSIRTVEGENVAHLTTDREEGFLWCEVVDRNVTDSETRAVNSEVEQRIEVTTHEKGFVMDKRGDEGCNSATMRETVVSEESVFSPEISGVPDTELSIVKIRGVEYVLLSVDEAEGEAKVVKRLNSDTEVSETNAVYATGGLSVMYDGMGDGGAPLLAFEYNGDDRFVSEERVSENTSIVTVNDESGDPVQTFMVRFTTPDSDGNMQVAVYDGDAVKTIVQGGTYEFGSQRFDIAAVTFANGGLESWTLLNQE